MHQPRNDLNIYKSGHLESIFVEVDLPKKSNIIIGCIYQNPSITFKDHYLTPLLEKILKENDKKKFFLQEILMLTC